MRIIAFITHSAGIRQILDHIGVQTEPPRIAPARGPPLLAEADAQGGEGVQAEGAQAMEPLPDWGEACQAAPDFEADQRTVGEGQNSEMTIAGRQAAPGTAHAWESRQISGNWL